MRHFRLEYILLYLHRISVFTQNLGQTLYIAYFSQKNSAIEIPSALQISSIVSTESCVLRYRGFARVL